MVAITLSHNRKDTVKSALEESASIDPSPEEAWSEAERELGVRGRVYDKWVEDKKLSWADARDRYARLRLACSMLKAILHLDEKLLAQFMQSVRILDKR